MCRSFYFCTQRILDNCSLYLSLRRFNSFVQRPNYQMRELLRESFHSIELVFPPSVAANIAAKSSHNDSTSVSGGNPRGASSQHTSSAIQAVRYPSQMPKPCLAVHVRNGDAMKGARACVLVHGRKVFDRSDSHTKHRASRRRVEEYRAHIRRPHVSTRYRMFDL